MIKWINKKRNTKGFTLIELIVVIAILGILAAIAVPRLSGARDNAEKKAVLANLRTIDSAISIAQADGKLLTGITDGTPTIANLKTQGYIATIPQVNDVATAYGIKGTGTGADPFLATVTLVEKAYGVTAAAAGTFTVDELTNNTNGVWK